MKLLLTILTTFLISSTLFASVSSRNHIRPVQKDYSIPVEFVYPPNELDSLLAPPAHLAKKTFPLELAQDSFLKTERDDEKIYYGSLILGRSESDRFVLFEIVQSMQRLGKMSQITHLLDHFIKRASADKNTELLSLIACFYANKLPCGIMVDSVFYVGANRSGRDKINGELLYTQKRFRVLALRQLMYALNLSETDSQRTKVYQALADVLKLHTDIQTLFKNKTNISLLPLLEKNLYTPDRKKYDLTFYDVPKDIYEAKNDGEWYRFCIAQVIKNAPHEGYKKWFDFVRTNYNCDYDEFSGSDSEMAPLTESLKNNEIFRLKVSNLNQFSKNDRYNTIEIPDDYNLILLASQLSADSLYYLGEIFKERKNYAKAVPFYKQALEKKENKEAITYLEKHAYNADRFGFNNAYNIVCELIELCSNQQEVTSAVTQKKDGIYFDLIFRNTPEIKSEIYTLNTDSYFQASKNFLKNIPLKERQKYYLQHEKFPYSEWSMKDLLLNSDTTLNLWGQKIGEFTSKLNPHQHYLLQEKITLNTQLPQGDYILKTTAPHGNIYYTLFTINNVEIISKPFKDSRLFIIVDAQTGKGIPNANIELFAYKIISFDANKIQRDSTRFEIQYKNISFKTNANGVAFYQPLDKDFCSILGVVTTENGQKAIIDQESYYGNFYKNDISHLPTKTYRTFTVTNQNVYRPGEQVKMAGFYRQIDLGTDEDINLLTPIDLMIKDRDNQIVFEKTITTTPDGCYEAEFTLPHGAKLGNYTGSLNTKHYYGRFYFNVEEYRKGEYEVNVSLDTAQKLGDSLFVTASASYYAGGKDYKGRAKIKIETQDDLDLPIPFYGRWNYLYRSFNIIEPVKKTVFDEEREVNAFGNIVVCIPTELNSVNPKSSRTYTAHVTWVNASNRTEKATQSIILNPQPFKIESKLNQEYYNLGDCIELTTHIERVKGYETKLEQTVAVSRIDKNGKTQKLKNTEINNAEKYSFTPEESGFYIFTYTVKNKNFLDSCVLSCIVYEKNKPIYAEKPFQIYKKTQFATVGEPTKILVSSSIKNGYLYIFEKPRNGIHQQLETQPLINGAVELEFNVTSDDVPNFFVELIVVGDNQEAHEIIDFMVPPENQTLKIAIDAPQKKCPPNKEITIPFTVKNNQNKGVSVPCIVMIYDVALDVFSAGLGADIYSVFLNKMYQFNYCNLFEVQQLNKHFYPEHMYCFLKHISPPSHYDINYPSYFTYFDLEGNLEFSPFTKRVHYGFGSSTAGCSGYRRKGEMRENLRSTPNFVSPKSAPEVRAKFSDAPYFNARILTDSVGRGEIKFKTPDNLGKFWIKIWAASMHTQIGAQTDSFIIGKELMLRIQTPRFLVQGDSILITASVQNESKIQQTVRVKLILDGKELASESVPQTLTIAPEREAEAKFAINAEKVGKGILTILAISEGEGEDDAMRVDFPIISREIEKVIRQSKAILTGQNNCEFELQLPKERVENHTQIQIDISPSLEMALIESLPYLVGYPHHCIEQTLNRFLPAVYLNQTLHDLKIAPDSIMHGIRPLQQKAIVGFDGNNNPIFSENPVYSDSFVCDATRIGLNRIFNMQQGDGWSWFPGGNIDLYMTSLVFEGLCELKSIHIPVEDQMFLSAKNLLQKNQAERLTRRLLPKTDTLFIDHFSDLDMRIAYLLEKVNASDSRMIEILLEDYPHLSLQSATYLGLMMHQLGKSNRVSEIQSYIEQYLKINHETQTAYLNLPDAKYFWYWYGDDMVTHAVYLRLLLITEPKSEKCAYLVNHMVNNRKNGFAWNSTLSTSMCVRALSDYLRQTYQKTESQKLKIFVNDTLLTDSVFMLANNVHTVKIRVERNNTNGPLFVQGNVTFNTQEKTIAASGHELKIQRTYFKRINEVASVRRPNYQGVMKTHFVRLSTRILLKEGDPVVEGDEIEVHLTVRANNDYEYLLITDPRGAGFESINSQSGYSYRPVSHFAEYRDLGVNYYIDRLPQGRHVFSYTLRAEKAGKFTALPSTIEPMYLPKLKANSAGSVLTITQPK